MQLPIMRSFCLLRYTRMIAELMRAKEIAPVSGHRAILFHVKPTRSRRLDPRNRDAVDRSNARHLEPSGMTSKTAAS